MDMSSGRREIAVRLETRIGAPLYLILASGIDISHRPRIYISKTAGSQKTIRSLSDIAGMPFLPSEWLVMPNNPLLLTAAD